MPLKVTLPINDFPPEVTVFPNVVASKLIGPPKVKFIPVTNVREPYILSKFPADPLRIGLFVTPVQVISLQRIVKVLSLTVCPDAEKEFASKNTSSSAVGNCVCKVAPPEV